MIDGNADMYLRKFLNWSGWTCGWLIQTHNYEAVSIMSPKLELQHTLYCWVHRWMKCNLCKFSRQASTVSYVPLVVFWHCINILGKAPLWVSTFPQLQVKHAVVVILWIIVERGRGLKPASKETNCITISYTNSWCILLKWFPKFFVFWPIKTRQCPPAKACHRLCMSEMWAGISPPLIIFIWVIFRGLKWWNYSIFHQEKDWRKLKINKCVADFFSLLSCLVSCQVGNHCLVI